MIVLLNTETNGTNEARGMRAEDRNGDSQLTSHLPSSIPVPVQVSRMVQLGDLTMCRVLWRILNLWWGGDGEGMGKGWGDVVDTVAV